MPCINSAHFHEWTTTGTLSIAKCESRCGFCTSIKEYKPASALRKHVATHIRNDGMSLTLAHSKGGRPKLQAVTGPYDVPEEPPRNPEPTREDSRSPSPVLSNSPACWRCTILGMECDRVLPCSACIGHDPHRTCGYQNLAEHASLIFWDNFEFPRFLQWISPKNRLVHIINFANGERIDSNRSYDYRTILSCPTSRLPKSMPRLLCFHPDLATFDPSLAIQAANTFLYHDDIFESFAGPGSTPNGLILLDACGRILDATDRVFTAALSDEPQMKALDVFCGLVSEPPGLHLDIKSMIKTFLSNLHRAMVKVRPAPSPEDILEAFHGILLLFMIRKTFRSILRYSRSRYAPFGYQVNQDQAFERGVTCTLYQPMLAVLEASKMTFNEMLIITQGDNTDPRTLVLVQAAGVIRIPNPMEKTPLEHILFFFEQTFPARVANTSQQLGSTATEPSEQLTAVDPSTYLDLPG